MRNLLAIVQLCFLPSVAMSQDAKTDWPPGSAMHTGLGLVEKRDYFAGLLEKKNAELVELVVRDRKFPDDRLAKALQAQHASWLLHRVAECELVGSLSGAGGSWPSTYAVQCEANLTDLRFRTVSSAIRCIQRIPVAQREFEQNRCLYQLAPLTFGK